MDNNTVNKLKLENELESKKEVKEPKETINNNDFIMDEELIKRSQDFDYTGSFFQSIKDWLDVTSFLSFSEYVKKRVIGQDGIDLILADIYNYIENIVYERKSNNNALMAAPSGCGKTETYRVLKEYFKRWIPLLPIAQVDVTAITEEGVVGASSELLISELMDSELGGYGIVFMDEFDKKLIPAMAEGANMNAAVQNQLLTIIEGRIVEELYEGHPTGYCIDTTKTMFIGMGSFNTTRETKKEDSKKGIGFGSISEVHDYFEDITREDMIKLGASYEMIGRFPYIINYHKLTDEAVDKIIDKLVNEISESLGTAIYISEDMRKLLHDSANGVYGCRLIDSKLRSSAMTSYIEILKQEKNRNKFGIYIESDTISKVMSLKSLHTLNK